MADLDLSQSEAEALIATEKHRIDEKLYTFPTPGGRLALQLQSPDRREGFVLDISRGTIKLIKGTFQNRSRQAVVLLRLDVEGARHRNPDGEEIDCPHLHTYREGYGDKWAVPAPPELVASDRSLYSTLGLFMTKCNVTLPPAIQNGLF